MGGGGGTTVVQPPPAPNYQESMREILKAQVEMAPQVYESEAKYQPLYNALQAAQQAFQVQQGLNISKQAYPQIAEIEAQYNIANRRAELGQLQTALPEYQRAFNALTPGYAEAVASTGQLARSAMAQSLNRPQFSSFQNAVRDPYGRLVSQPQPQIAPAPGAAQTSQNEFAFLGQRPTGQPQGEGKGTPPAPAVQGGNFSDQMRGQLQGQTAIAPSATPAPPIQFDQASADRFKQLTEDMRGIAPSTPPPPPSLGFVPNGQPMSKFLAAFGNAMLKPQIDAAKEEYKTTLANFNDEEARKQKDAAAYLGNFNAAAAIAPQQQAAQQAVGANLLGASAPPVSAVGGPGIMLGQMQGPALPPGPLGAGGTPVSAAGGPEVMAGQMQGPALPPGFQAQAPAVSQTQGGGKATPPAPQGPTGDYNGRLKEQILRQQGTAPSTAQTNQYQQAYSQNQQQMQGQQGTAQQGGGKGVPPAPQGPGGNFSGQMQQVLSPLEQTPAGGYVNAVGNFVPSQGTGRSADMLLSQSQRELAAGRSLTAEEQRIADQSARSAYAARGMALGNQAIGAEILNRADVANQRYQLRLQNATNAAQVGMSQQELLRSAQAQRYQQAMGREELSAATQQNAFNQALQRGQAEQQTYAAGTQAQAAQAALGTGAMSQLQAAQAPILQAFYKQPILQGQENQAQNMAMAMQQQAGPQYFNPESQTGMGSIYGAYNSQMNLAGASLQAQAAAQAGKSSMLGSIGGALIGGAATVF